MPNTLPPWNSFYSELTESINREIALLYHTTITLIQYPSQGGFFWYYQNQNQVFNDGTFAYASARVSQSEVPALAEISAAGGFPNAYIQVISSIEYVLSQEDSDALEEAQARAQQLGQDVVASYASACGPIGPQEMRIGQSMVGGGVIVTPLDYVLSYALGYVWSGKQESGEPPRLYTEMATAPNLAELLPNKPPSGQDVLTKVARYLAELVTVLRGRDQQILGNWLLQQLKRNTRNPTQANGGMKTVNPNTGEVSTGYQVGYGIHSALATIAQALNDTGKTLEVTLAVPKDCEAAQKALEPAPGAGEAQTVVISYPGYVMVPMGPTAFQQATTAGWFDGDPIAQAYRNGEKNVTGFKFSSPPGYDLGSLADGGDFGQLKSLLISRSPTFTVRYGKGDSLRVEEKQRDRLMAPLAHFEAILGSPKGVEYAATVLRGPRSDRFSVTYAPVARERNATEITVPLLEQAAYVIGGTFDFPAVGSG